MKNKIRFKAFYGYLFCIEIQNYKSEGIHDLYFHWIMPGNIYFKLHCVYDTIRDGIEYILLSDVTQVASLSQWFFLLFHGYKNNFGETSLPANSFTVTFYYFKALK